jgi:hypothetical protein
MDWIHLAVEWDQWQELHVSLPLDQPKDLQQALR